MAPVYKHFPVPAYKVSKSALNMLTVQHALYYSEEGFTFMAISPGVSNLMPISSCATFIMRVINLISGL